VNLIQGDELLLLRLEISADPTPDQAAN